MERKNEASLPMTKREEEKMSMINITMTKAFDKIPH